jgi:hypothetical protein
LKKIILSLIVTITPTPTIKIITLAKNKTPYYTFYNKKNPTKMR